MSQESLESILDAARKLPPDEQRRLAEQIAKEFSNRFAQDSFTEQFMKSVSYDEQRFIKEFRDAISSLQIPLDEQTAKVFSKYEHRLAEQFLKQIIANAIEQIVVEISQNTFRPHEQIGKEINIAMPVSNRTQRALEAVEKTRGSMKGLDRDTIIWLAEDEELRACTTNQFAADNTSR